MGLRQNHLGGTVGVWLVGGEMEDADFLTWGFSQSLVRGLLCTGAPAPIP